MSGFVVALRKVLFACMVLFLGRWLCGRGYLAGAPSLYLLGGICALARLLNGLARPYGDYAAGGLASLEALPRGWNI